MNVVSVVLAAGRGRRLGGPKALLAWAVDGSEVPLAWAHAQARLAADSQRVLIVTRADIASQLQRHAPGPSDAVDLVISSAADALGPAGSIAAAAQHMAQLQLTEPVAVLTPVDCPPATFATVAALLAPLSSDSTLLAVRPQHGGRRGHPVALRWPLLQRYLQGPPLPLRDVLRALPDRSCSVEVADPQVLLDLDTEEQLGRALRFFGSL